MNISELSDADYRLAKSRMLRGQPITAPARADDDVRHLDAAAYRKAKSKLLGSSADHIDPETDVRDLPASDYEAAKREMLSRTFVESAQ